MALLHHVLHSVLEHCEAAHARADEDASLGLVQALRLQGKSVEVP